MSPYIFEGKSVANLGSEVEGTRVIHVQVGVQCVICICIFDWQADLLRKPNYLILQ